MTRPENLSYEDFQRWDELLEQDLQIPTLVSNEPTIREVLYAGLWLSEQLEKLSCPSEYIVRIQYTAGAICFGRDPWEVHQDLLERYKNNELQFDPDPNPNNLN